MPPFTTFNPNTNFCERPICLAGTQLDAAGKVCVEQFTLTLNAPAGDLEPSGTAAGDANSSKAMSVLVKSAQTGLPKNLAKVRITLGVVDGTGGHDHSDPSRPKGTLIGCAATPNLPNNYDCTTGTDGFANVTFKSTQVSGTHTLSASCITPVCTNSQAAAQDVKVPNLSPIPAAFPLYVLDESGSGGIVQPIGWTATHHDNHGATAAAQAGLLKLAKMYQSQINPGAGLYINDASLPWGGVFDMYGDWKKPHGTHREGDALDIRAESAAGKLGEVPKSMFGELQDAKVKGMTAEIHCYENGAIKIAKP